MTLTVISWIVILLGIVTAVAIAIDCYQRPQHMNVMNVTWPITGLYFPVVGWWIYAVMGRPDGMPRDGSDHDHGGHDHSGHDHGHDDDGGCGHHHAPKPKWQSVFVGVTHCGGGCTLGDSVAIPIVALTGFTVAGSILLGHFAAEFVAAYLFGILFQFLPAMSMGETNPFKALVNAIKADTLSLISFQIGMYGWMALASLVLLPEEPSAGTPVFWFMMQIAMVIGFATAYPANWWLINRGIKHGM
ncbi:DUF4396 domain-containing protein [Salinisphaera hydrothermalis]|uniref:DUF4396 domain-containing protein n=1 Tax=Salinisphaera hydrothermalis (strain C41B8) TaxID=1304275 RepID=A0A084IH87_SALHC|nr:DUF4396 domain-containing protein [Salinisphaera hydrothermalis]KEZ76071.1 hypothetical protein C41B8_16694 [Salinisphaera hydrothermalis C41B8]